MQTVVSAVRVVIWFVYQAVIVGGIGAAYFLIPFAILIALLVTAFLRIDRNIRRHLLSMLLCLPAIWLFIGIWGGLFWLDLAHRPVIRNPNWVEYPLVAAPWLFLLAVGVFTWRLRGARVFTLTYALVNLYFMLAMSVLSGMAVTGSWL